MAGEKETCSLISFHLRQSPEMPFLGVYILPSSFRTPHQVPYISTSNSHAGWQLCMANKTLSSCVFMYLCLSFFLSLTLKSFFLFIHQIYSSFRGMCMYQDPCHRKLLHTWNSVFRCFLARILCTFIPFTEVEYKPSL